MPCCWWVVHVQTVGRTVEEKEIGSTKATSRPVWESCFPRDQDSTTKVQAGHFSSLPAVFSILRLPEILPKSSVSTKCRESVYVLIIRRTKNVSLNNYV